MVTGGALPVVSVLDMATRSVLRRFEGHTGPVHATAFSMDNTHILSCSDDKTCRYWDLPGEKAVAILGGHSDYVRAASCNPTKYSMWATGGYDHTVKIWDMNVACNKQDASRPMMEVNHGDPIESCLFLPSGHLMLSAGGTTIKVWDMISGGKCLHTFSNHQKTITDITLDGTGTRLLSASLDGHVKVYDLETYKVSHGFKYNSGILSMGISKNNSHLVVGTANQQVVVRERKVKAHEEQTETDFMYTVKGTLKPSTIGNAVQNTKYKRLANYDKALRKFEYKLALDAALETRSPIVVASMIEELQIRNGLSKALANRQESSLEPFLSFLVKYIANPRYTFLLVNVCHLVCDLYLKTIGKSTVIDALFLKLKRRLQEEMKVQHEILQVVGMLDTIFSTQYRKTATKHRIESIEAPVSKKLQV